MQSRILRREFLSRMGAAAVAASLPLKALHARELHYPPAKVSRRKTGRDGMKSPFRVAVINDEIGQDFGRACEVAAREFGMEWIELRGMWKKNILNLDTKEVAEARRILEKYKLRVTDIASPLFKVDWPGAPKSKFRPRGAQFNADFSYEQQGEVLERSIALAKTFQTDRVRCFDFWRLEDQAPYRAAINAKLLDAANAAGKQGIILILENEFACNTATGAEAAQVLAAVQSSAFMVNWDPGNAAARGETPYPDGYNLLPKSRIGHCHCKDIKSIAKATDAKEPGWAAMGAGVIDWAGQFAALKRDGYGYAVSLETHWSGAATPEESTRQSWAGMKEQLQRAGALA